MLVLSGIEGSIDSMNGTTSDGQLPRSGPLRAVAGVIERKGVFLIGQRLPDDSLGGYWEFPGGKIEVGETPVECLQRELREELGVETRIGSLVCTVRPSESFQLTVHRASIVEGEPELREHTELRWVSLEEMQRYDMLPADRPVVERLVEESGRD